MEPSFFYSLENMFCSNLGDNSVRSLQPALTSSTKFILKTVTLARGAREHRDGVTDDMTGQEKSMAGRELPNTRHAFSHAHRASGDRDSVTSKGRYVPSFKQTFFQRSWSMKAI